MPTIVVAILCIALVVVGGLTMSQGIMSSADTTALGFEEITAVPMLPELEYDTLHS